MTEEPIENLLGRLAGKVMMLEAATAMLMASALRGHPDPLGALAAFESALDRRRKQFLPDWPDHANDAAADTVDVLIREGQFFLDLLEEDGAGRPKPE